MNQFRSFFRLSCKAHVFALLEVLSSFCLADGSSFPKRIESIAKGAEAFGVSFQANYTGEQFAVLDGGFRNASQWNGLFDVGADVDLEKALGWEGTRFFANAFYYKGNDLSSDALGDFGVISNLITDTEFSIYNIYLFHELSDTLAVKWGQLAYDDDFMGSEVAALFINANFGPLPVLSGNHGIPIYSLAAPGVWGQYSFSDSIALQLGIYSGDAGLAGVGNHGFEWRLGGASGFAFAGELSHRYRQSHDAMSQLSIGGLFNSGEFDNFHDGSVDDGNSLIYSMWEHHRLRLGHMDWGVFARAGLSPNQEQNTVHYYVDCGFQKMGMVSARPRDLAGVAISYTEFSSDYRRATRASGDFVTSYELVIEATYQAQLKEHFTVQPDFQLIVNPHSSGVDAWGAGIRFDFEI